MFVVVLLVVLGAVANTKARIVVVALDAPVDLRNQIEMACIHYGVLLFHVPTQAELGNAASVAVPIGACAIVGAPDDKEDLLR